MGIARGVLLGSKVREAEHNKSIIASMGKSLSRNKRNHASSAVKSVTGKKTVRKTVPEVGILELVGADETVRVPKPKRIDQLQGTKSSIVRCTRELRGVGVAVGRAQH